MTHQVSSDEPLVERIAEEILARRRRGEEPELDEYYRQYPDHAADLRAFLPALLAVEHLKPDSHDESGTFGSAVQLDGQRLERVGDYRILREIGRGGMGVVYEAEQESLGRRVALKVLPRQLAGDAKALERFQREARAAARMHHTNIVPVFDVGRDNEHLFYAMQLIQGQGLDEVIDELKRLRSEHKSSGDQTPRSRFVDENQGNHVPHIAQSLMSGRFQQQDLAADQDASDRGPQAAATEGDVSSSSVFEPAPATVDYASSSTSSVTLPGQSDLSIAESNRAAYFRSVAEIGVQVIDALSYAHARGIIHRDIKPSNLLLDAAGIVWITDFGLAKTGEGSMTHTGDILGTIRYMSPERFRGQCDVRADIYALGMTLYELLVLKPAFDSPDRLKLIDMVTRTEPPTPRSIDPRVPRDLETIVLKSIDKDPKRRYQSADELAEDLQRFIDDAPIKARRTSVVERLTRWSRRNKGLAASLAAVLLMLVGIAVASTLAAAHFSRQEANQRQLANENGRLAKERENSLQREERIRKEAETTAYHSLAGEARGLRLARLPGYRAAAWSRIATALAIDTPERDIDSLRREAAACLGDFLGNEPLVRTEPDSRPIMFSWFPDSQRVAVALENGIVSIRMIETNEEVGRLETASGRPQAIVRDLQVAPDGHHIVVLAASGGVEVWCSDPTGAWNRAQIHDAPTGEAYFAVRCFPDGQRFLIGGRNAKDRTIQINILELTDDTLGRSLELEEAGGSAPSISADGRLVAYRLNQSDIGVWNTDTGALEHTIHTPFSGIYDWAFTPDGTSFVVSGEGLVVYDTEQFSQQSLVRLDVINAITFTADSRVMAFGTLSKKVRLWSLNAMREIAAFDAPPDFVFGDPVTMSPDSRWLIAASESETHIWRLKGRPEKRTLAGHGTWVPCNTFSHDSKLLATASKDNTAKLWDVETGKLLHTFPLEGFGQAVAFSPDDRLLAVGEYDPSGRLIIFDVETKEQVAVRKASFFQALRGVYHLSFTPDGKTLVSAGSFGLEILDVDRTGMDGNGGGGGEAAAKLTLRGSVSGFRLSAETSVSPDGRTVAFAKGFRPSLWDLMEEREVDRFPGDRLFMQAWHNISYLPDSRHVLFVATNGRPQVWDTESGEMAYEITETRPFLSFHNDVSPDGRWLAADATVEALTIVDLQSRSELFTLGIEPSPIKSVSWSPNGQHIALGQADGGVVIWDFAEIRRQLDEAGLGWE